MNIRKSWLKKNTARYAIPEEKVREKLVGFSTKLGV